MAVLKIYPERRLGKINEEIYGHFAEHLGRCIYGGIYVGEDSAIENVNGMRRDVVEALKQIRVPVLRWPGGCFADEYHWKDGIGPKSERKKMINTHWGGVVEDNSFGTHEYFELCRQLGCKSYINGNVGSGTVQEMAQWIEYMTFEGTSPMADLRKANGHKEPWQVDYFAVGNENWGCGGNMNPEYYANEYRRYQTYVRDYRKESHIQKICCGSNADFYDWTQTVMETCFSHCPPVFHGFMDGLSLHYYVYPEDSTDWRCRGSATEFDEAIWYKTLSKAIYMDELIKRHGAIMDVYDPEKIIGLIVDEWGNWYDVEPGTNPGFLYQQNTMRDALTTAVTLNIFNKHSDRVKMANLAQIVNVLQAVLLTEGAQMIKTPTYYVFDLYKYHQNGQLLDSTVETQMIGLEEAYMVPNLSESVSIDENGIIHVTAANLSVDTSCTIDVDMGGINVGDIYSEILSGEIHSMNTFEAPDTIQTEIFDKTEKIAGGFRFVIPASSIIHLAVKPECALKL